MPHLGSVHRLECGNKKTLSKKWEKTLKCKFYPKKSHLCTLASENVHFYTNFFFIFAEDIKKWLRRG